MPRAPPFASIVAASGSHVTLWEEDCLDGIPRHLPARSVDVVVTSPPYNVGAPYGRYRDRRPRADYVRWLSRAGTRLARVIADEGSVFFNLGGSPSDPWLPWDAARALGRTLVLQNVIHWVKSIAIGREFAGEASGLDRDLALGHYKPLRSDRYLHNAHEYVFHFTREGRVPLDRLAIGVPYQDKSNVARWHASPLDRRCRGNVWFLPYPTIQRRDRDRPHPTPFPPELPDFCLRLHGLDRIRLVLDPFVGIGSSALAATRLGLDFVGFDVDRDYLAVARDRVGREDGRPVARARAKAQVPSSPPFTVVE